METPHQILKRLKISSTSYIRACLDMHSWEEYLTISKYKQEIENIIGAPCTTDFQSQKVAHLYFGYLVQGLVKVLQTGAIPDLEIIWNTAQNNAVVFMKQHPFSTNEYRSESDSIQESWQERATTIFKQNPTLSKKELMLLTSKAVGKSVPYVTLFFNEIKDVIGYIEHTTTKNTIELKEVDNYYKNNLDKPRAELMQGLMSSFRFSESTANNHFYRCKRLYGDCRLTDKKDTSIKPKVFIFLKDFSTEQLLNKKEMCDKIVKTFDISQSVALTYLYNYLKISNIQLPTETKKGKQK